MVVVEQTVHSNSCEIYKDLKEENQQLSQEVERMKYKMENMVEDNQSYYCDKCDGYTDRRRFDFNMQVCNHCLTQQPETTEKE